MAKKIDEPMAAVQCQPKVAIGIAIPYAPAAAKPA